MGGDDTLFDHFIRARNRMEELADPSYTGWGPDGRSPVGHPKKKRYILQYGHSI
jgi:hypothetical protein